MPTDISLYWKTVSESERASLQAALPFLLGSGLLGTIGVFFHEAHTDPMSATWFRCAFGLLGLTLWLSCRRQLGALKLNLRAVPWVLLAGILLVAGGALFLAAIGHQPSAVDGNGRPLRSDLQRRSGS